MTDRPQFIIHDKPLGENCTIICFCSHFIYLFCKGMKAQIAGEHLKNLLTSGKVFKHWMQQGVQFKINRSLTLLKSQTIIYSVKYPTENPVP